MPKKVGTLIKTYSVKRELKPGFVVDSVILIYRDENGVKKTKFVDRAEVPYYVIKDKESYEAENPPLYIKRELVEEHHTYSDLLFREIAMKTEALPYYDRVRANYGPNSYAMNNLMKHKWLYDTDMNIEDRYVAKFHDEYEPDIKYRPHKCYFDIEVDLYPNGLSKPEYPDFPHEDLAPCPVNIITLIDGKNLDTYTFAYDNNLNVSIKEFKKDIPSFEKYLRDKVSEEDLLSLGKIDIKFFDTEVETIEAFLKKTHEIDPDFMMAWNQSFDVKTLINRLTKLYDKDKSLKEQGIRGRERMITTFTDSKYSMVKDSNGQFVYLNPRVWYKVDTYNENNFQHRVDSFTVLDGINWVDSMLYFANIRAHEAKRDSYSLNAIAFEELGKEKLEFGVGETISNLAYKNYSRFVEYNIRDVLLLHMLEEKGLDMNLVQLLSQITNTRKDKVFTKTTSVKNLFALYAKDNGYVIRNNINAKYNENNRGNFQAPSETDVYANTYLKKSDYVEPSEDYKELLEMIDNFGGYVVDPDQNDNDNGVVLGGVRSNRIFSNVIDEDLASLYPSIIRAFNIDESTLVGKFFLHDEEILDKFRERYDAANVYEKKEEEYTELGLRLADSLISQDFTRIGSMYFDLPTTSEVLDGIQDIIDKK